MKPQPVSLLARQLVFAAEGFSLFQSFLVEPFQFFRLAADAVNLHGPLRANGYDFSPVLHALYEFELSVVDLGAMAQCHSKPRIFPVDE